MKPSRKSYATSIKSDSSKGSQKSHSSKNSQKSLYPVEAVTIHTIKVYQIKANLLVKNKQNSSSSNGEACKQKVKVVRKKKTTRI